MTLKTKKLEAYMKNELILSSLILTAQITPNALAAEAIQKELTQGVQETVIKTPLLKIYHPFKDQVTIEAYAVITIVKNNTPMEDLNLGKVTHNVSFKFFDRADQEIKEFEVNESDEGGFYLELRGAMKDRKSYVLWSCSSTMNCGFEAPGFLHVYDQETTPASYYYTVDLPVIKFSENGDQKHERININFELPRKLLR